MKMKTHLSSNCISILHQIQLRATVLVVAACLGATSYAGFNQYSIGLKFGPDATGGGGGVFMTPPDVAGLPAVAQPNWNNMPGLAGTTNGLGVTDNSGSPTAVQVTWNTALGLWGSGAN